VVPNGLFECADGQCVVIGGNANAVFTRFMAAIGRTDLAQDPTLADPPGRAGRADELNQAIADWAGQRAAADVLAVLDAAGVPAGPVLDAAGIAADPHYRARDMLTTHHVPVNGVDREVRFPGVVPKVPGTPARPRWLGPELGAHTDAVLTELLGLSGAELDRLRADGVI
jgi:formyl-CoA transferase